MKITKTLLLISVTLITLSCSSFKGKVKDKMMEKVRINRIENVQLKNLSTIVIDVNVTNDSYHSFEILNGRIEMGLPGEDPMVTAILSDTLEVDRRSTQTVCSTWKFRTSGIAALGYLSKALGGDTNGLVISGSADVRSSIFKHTFSRKNIPLSDIIATFGQKD